MTDRLIYDNNKSEIFCREDPDSGRRVAVKVLNFAFPTPEDIARFYNVLEIAPLFSSPILSTWSLSAPLQTKIPVNHSND